MTKEILDIDVEKLQSNPKYLAQKVLQTDDIFYRMVLMNVCGGKENMKVTYPELFI